MTVAEVKARAENLGLEVVDLGDEFILKDIRNKHSVGGGVSWGMAMSFSGHYRMRELDKELRYIEKERANGQ